MTLTLLLDLDDTLLNTNIRFLHPRLFSGIVK